jgi:hypothetical protein
VIQDDKASNNENCRKKHSPSSKDYGSALTTRNKTKRRRENVSWVWQHFQKEGSMATCQFCQASLSASSTTTLKYHLNHLQKDLITNETTTTDSTNASQTEITEIEPAITITEIVK